MFKYYSELMGNAFILSKRQNRMTGHALDSKGYKSLATSGL